METSLTLVTLNLTLNLTLIVILVLTPFEGYSDGVIHLFIQRRAYARQGCRGADNDGALS